MASFNWNYPDKETAEKMYREFRNLRMTVSMPWQDCRGRWTLTIIIGGK